MEQHGFIRDMLDVKVLILFVASKAQYPMTLQKVYELCFQDDKLSYFDVSIAVPQMVETGHLQELEKGSFVITDRGREAEAVTEDAIAYPGMQRAKAAVEKFNAEMRRGSLISTEICEREQGGCTVKFSLNDGRSDLMKIELMAPNRQQADALERAFRKRAESLYRTIMTELISESEKRGS